MARGEILTVVNYISPATSSRLHQALAHDIFQLPLIYGLTLF